MAYINGIAAKTILCIDNAQHSFIIHSDAHFSIVARGYLENHFPNWEKQVLPTKAKNFKSASGKMTSIGTIIKEMIIPHRKANIRLHPELLVLEDAHIQGFLMGTDYQRILLRRCRKNRSAFSIGEKPLGKIRGHDIEIYLNVERPYPPILRRSPYPENLETRREIEKNINEILDINVVRRIGQNEKVKITRPVLITWHDDKSRLCGGFQSPE
ncbi:hypothetical protein O181_027887 [Austropuccinia psidii MF-1]|uniref:Uncharacterized protein n=1 Tax=Austropuccinia psidii MF-1 TaxID=1389203 RepID=A0A9Q3H238_9BASI|nr:hypothetical protein [Austropuccinia psidii MF-1]